MILPIILLLPVASGIINYLFFPDTKKNIAFLVQFVIVALCAYLFILEDILHAAPIIHNMGGYDAPYAITLIADPVSVLMLLMTSLIFLVVISFEYHSDLLNRHFTLLLLLLESLVMTVFLVQDLFTIYAISEVGTIVASILIMYKKKGKNLYEGLVYMLVNIIAMTFFLLGIGYVYKQFGTTNLLILSQVINKVPGKTVLLPYAFLITGISTKILFLPVFSWLTKAHVTDSAPYIVSAILSGLYIKTGIFIFFRLQNVFSQVLDTSTLFMVLAFISAILAAFLGAFQKDILHLLAYSTVSQIGLIIFSLSIGSEEAYYGAVYHILNHGMLKVLLFLSLGLVVDTYNTRDISQIKGVLKNSPFLGVIIIVGLLGLTGAPFFNGSISKYLIQRGLTQNSSDWLLVFMNLFTFLYAYPLFMILKGETSNKLNIPKNKKAVLIILGLICLTGGIFGHNFVNTFFSLKIQWSLVNYLEKSLVYGISLLIGGITHKFIRPLIEHHTLLGQIELTFNEISAFILLAFSGLLGYLMFFI